MTSPVMHKRILYSLFLKFMVLRLLSRLCASVRRHMTTDAFCIYDGLVFS